MTIVAPIGMQGSNGQGETPIPTPPTPKDQCRVYQVEADCWIYRKIVGILGGVIAVTLLGSFGLLITGRPVHERVVTFSSGVLGALAGLLAPRSADRVVRRFLLALTRFGQSVYPSVDR